MDKDISTTELLETIIGSLSIQDELVNAMRVSRTWKTTTNNSLALQQHLFFASVKRSPGYETR